MSSVGIQKLLQTMLVAYAAELPEREPIRQQRYYDFNVDSPRKLEEKLRDMHENPVRRG
jgi:ferritin-like protein